MGRCRRMPLAPLSFPALSQRVIPMHVVPPTQQLPTAVPKVVRNWGANQVLHDVPLWVGGHADALDARALEERGIRYVVNVAEECADLPDALSYTISCPEPQRGSAIASVLRLGLADDCDAQAAPLFIPCAEKVSRALEHGDGVLIHCRSGVSRGPTFATAVAMLLKGLSAEAALDRIREARPQANPNLGFILALSDFEREAQGFHDFAVQARQSGRTANAQMSALLQWYSSHGPNGGMFAAGDAAADPSSQSEQNLALIVPRDRIAETDTVSSDGLSDSEEGL